MNIRSAVALSLSLSLAAVAAAHAQGDKAKPSGMESMMKAGAPNDHHKSLQRFTGDFSYHMKVWTAPCQPPAESDGTMHGESLLGGRFVQMVYHGQLMGQAFEGRGLQGFDNHKNELINYWMSNMDTGVQSSSGPCEDATHKVCTLLANITDAKGQPVTTKQVITWVDDNNYRMEMFLVRPGGESTQSFEITGKRK